MISNIFSNYTSLIYSVVSVEKRIAAIQCSLCLTLLISAIMLKTHHLKENRGTVFFLTISLFLCACTLFNAHYYQRLFPHKTEYATFIVCIYVWFFMALITTLVLCARSQDSLPSASVRRVNVVFSTAGFKGRGKS